ncbi:methyltransferase domain-containing protein [Listeria monocytogenes]|nr:methyltransferase domain-containing protein [Listeria monocytogenes]
MKLDSQRWMDYSIDISKKACQAELRVGAVLVSEQNELICSAFSGENSSSSWVNILLEKVVENGISSAKSIYVTINTLSERYSFDMIKILSEVQIDEIYMGLPDPSLTEYLVIDPFLKLNSVYRYPDILQREIIKMNSEFFDNSTQNITASPYYSSNRISNLVIENLESKGILVSKDELNSNKSESALASLLCTRYSINYIEALQLVKSTISLAFNRKYGTYNYTDDARSFDVGWIENFMSFFQQTTSRDIENSSILSVGVGSGHEAIALFSKCRNVTFVDIAPGGLEKIKAYKPSAETIVSSAIDLSSVPNNSKDVYVSLRTYNSSFFDIKKAILEAYRTLKQGAAIIISIANGFLCPERNCIIPGLIVPGTGFIDIYRGMDTAKQLQYELELSGFTGISFYPTNTEIYLSAIVD